MTEQAERTYYAISGIGWGRGATQDEALENYRRVQLSNFRGSDFVTEEVLTTGALAPDVWLAPADADGFVLDGELWWTIEGSDETRRCELDQRVLDQRELRNAAS